MKEQELELLLLVTVIFKIAIDFLYLILVKTLMHVRELSLKKKHQEGMTYQRMYKVHLIKH